MMGVLMTLGWLLLTLLKIAGILLLILLVLLALVLLCPLCADVCWEGGVLTVNVPKQDEKANVTKISID